MIIEVGDKIRRVVPADGKKHFHNYKPMHVRAVVDDEIVVLRWWDGARWRYMMDYVAVLEYCFEEGSHSLEKVK